MASEAKGFLERWVSLSNKRPKLAEKLSDLVQNVLSQDRIDAVGVQRTIDSPEMKQLQLFLTANAEVLEILQLSDVSPVTILRAIDLFALALIFNKERPTSSI
jgi:hypothetical protein